MPEYSYQKRAKEAGVDSFWYKEVSPEPIIELMDRTMNGERVFPDTTPKIKFGNRTDKCENAADIKHSHIVCTVVKSCKCGDTENGDD